MPFELSTAKPVEQVKTGFDISTATEAQPQAGGALPFVNPLAETALALGSGFVRTVGGGIAGIVQALNPTAEPGAGGDIVKSIQAGTFQPESPQGKEALQNLGALVQGGVDIANFPLSGLAGLTELISGQGLDQAIQTIKSTQEKGISTTAGQRVFEETESPLAATIAETAPTAVVELIGLKGGATALKQAPRVAQAGREIATQAVEQIAPVVESAKTLIGDVSKFQSPILKRSIKVLPATSVGLLV